MPAHNMGFCYAIGMRKLFFSLSLAIMYLMQPAKSLTGLAQKRQTPLLQFTFLNLKSRQRSYYFRNKFE
jgi:hypothetical protein